MRTKRKKVSQQVIVITGATSGIGLATARAAVKRGARVVLVARNDEDLHRIAADIVAEGGEALAVAADVADVHALERVRDLALQRFGGFDAWVNNAGLSIYGKLFETDMVEARRLFDVNVWGVVNGSRVALSHLGEHGGAIVNVGSILSERAIPLQGFYSASKHAVKGFTDALRMEVEMDGLPVWVSLVKPAAIDTPYTDHARNHLEHAPKHVPPVYAPELVADAILHCCEHPTRDVIVGGAGKVFSLLEKFAPRLTDRIMETQMAPEKQQDPERVRSQEDSLFMAPLFEGSERGNHRGRTLERSLYTTLALHPFAAAAAGLGLALAAVGFGAYARAR